MGARKDHLMREAALSLAQVKAIRLHEIVFERKLWAKKWATASSYVRPEDLDDAGIGVRWNGKDDVYDFTDDLQRPDIYRCYEIVGQWQVEAAENIRGKEENVTELARRCNVTRQSLYRILRGHSGGLQYLYTLRRKNPQLYWKGKPLLEEYQRVKGDLAFYKIMAPLVEAQAWD